MNETVLIIDEDVNAQIIAETLLRLRGLNVRVTADPAAACQIVSHDAVGVVVLDLSMPGTSGLETLRRLRALKPEPHLIAVSRRREPEVERFARRLGVDAFFRKPVEPGRFIAAVERLLPDTAPGVVALRPA